MNVKAIVPLIAGLGIAGVAGKLGFDYLKKAQASQPKQVKIWAAAADIPRGSRIEEPMLKTITFPASAVPPGAFQDKTKLIGRVPNLVAPAGLPLLETMLTAPGTSPGIIVPAGLRAVAVKIDESSGVDNHLQPGVWVDVIGFFKGRGARSNVTIARPVVENVQVAAVGSQISAGGTSNPAAAQEKPKPGSKNDRPARAVTLLVRADDVSKLHLAEQQGKIKLSMRNAEDGGDGGASGKGIVTSADVIGEDEEASPSEPTGNWLTGLLEKFGPKPADPNAPKVAVAPPPPPAPVKPKPVWQMTIRNGQETKVLGWVSMDSIDPQEIAADPQSIFEDNDSIGGGTVAPPPSTQQPGTEPEPQPEPTSTPTQEGDEPQELNG